MTSAAMKTFVIVNPHSANRSTGRKWPDMRNAIHQTLGAFEERFTTAPGHAVELARQALTAGAERIIAVGGDGTNNEVVNGFFDGTNLIRPTAVFGMIPRGTGGDFRKTFKIGTSLTECLSIIAAGHTRSIDVGQAKFQDAAGLPVQRLFINITSFGIGGMVDANVNRSSKALGGKASFLIGTFKALLAYHNKLVRLKVDDSFDQRLTINNVAVANGQYFGGGMWVAPQATVDDGLFDVVILGDYSRSEVVFRASRIYKGTHLQDPKVRHLRGKHIEATCDEEVLIDMDGEQPGRLPISLDILPQALKVLLPR